MLRKCIANLIFYKKFSTCPILTNTFESKICIKNIYPESSLDICKASQVTLSKDSGPFTGFIPLEELSISFSRSSGPGGQNVNKVNSKVDLRFHVASANWLPTDIRTKLADKFQTYINAEGFFIVRSERTRSQQLNLADALDKLRWMIKTASFTSPPPSYKDLEIKRRRLEKATRERLREKRERSLIKKERQGFDFE